MVVSVGKPTVNKGGQMELTLKNIKSFSRFFTSESFECDVYIDGRLAGTAENRGNDHLHGVWWTHDEGLGLAFEMWLDDQTVPVDYGNGEIYLLETVEEKLTHLITAFLDEHDKRTNAVNVVELDAALA